MWINKADFGREWSLKWV